MNIIFNENCFDTINRNDISKVDVIMTTIDINNITSDDNNINYHIKLFNNFDKILNNNGVILYCIPYNNKKPYFNWLLVSDIIRNTNFTSPDYLIWKKEKPLLNNRSRNKLNKYSDIIFVFCRKKEVKTYHVNKTPLSYSEKTDKPILYSECNDFIETKNIQDKNMLLYELYSNLLKIYGKVGGTIYDPFIKYGMSAKAAIQYNMNYIGSEYDNDKYLSCLSNIHTTSIIDDTYKVNIRISNIDDDYWNN